MIDVESAVTILREIIAEMHERHVRETRDRLDKLERNYRDAGMVTKSTDAAPWSPTRGYEPDDVVSHGGYRWRSLGYSAGIEPGQERTGTLRAWTLA